MSRTDDAHRSASNSVSISGATEQLTGEFGSAATENFGTSGFVCRWWRSSRNCDASLDRHRSSRRKVALGRDGLGCIVEAMCSSTEPVSQAKTGCAVGSLNQCSVPQRAYLVYLSKTTSFLRGYKCKKLLT
jgi:hypothetical protein